MLFRAYSVARSLHTASLSLPAAWSALMQTIAGASSSLLPRVGHTSHRVSYASFGKPSNTVAKALSSSLPSHPPLPLALAFQTVNAASPSTRGAAAWRRPALSMHAKSGEAATTEAETATLSSTGPPPPASETAQPQLVLITGAYVLPHPDKMTKGGEDWFYIADTARSIGVADGVGGWAEIGVDAGAYARQLMGYAKLHADRITKPGSQEYQALCASLNPNVDGSKSIDVSAASTSVKLQQVILERAYYMTEIRGSSTACVVVMAGDRVLASNLGDSGFLVIRDGQVMFHSPQQQHKFNFPYQIGSVDSMSDLPQAAQQFELLVQPGDVLVMGTDGLWDNCFDEEIVSVIRYCQNVNMQMDKAAQVLAHYARHRASDPKFASPFAYAAFQAGFPYMGGKMDDITVLVARVADAAEIETTPAPGSGGMNLTMPGTPKSKL